MNAGVSRKSFFDFNGYLLNYGPPFCSSNCSLREKVAPFVEIQVDSFCLLGIVHKISCPSFMKFVKLDIK